MAARDLTGMIDPRATQNNIQTTVCRRGWDSNRAAIVGGVRRH
jgi:hypothetical protein